MLTTKTMKTLSAAVMLVLAGPVLASPPHGSRYDRHHRVHKKVVVVEHRHRYRHPVRTVVVERPVYVAPRPVYVGPPPVVFHRTAAEYGPPPSQDLPASSVLGTLGGAAVGAAIGSQIGQGRGNTAAIAIGAVVGGMIGSGL